VWLNGDCGVKSKGKRHGAPRLGEVEKEVFFCFFFEKEGLISCEGSFLISF
jgi:hypothetical protein